MDSVLWTWWYVLTMNVPCQSEERRNGHVGSNVFTPGTVTVRTLQVKHRELVSSNVHLQIHLALALLVNIPNNDHVRHCPASIEDA